MSYAVLQAYTQVEREIMARESRARKPCTSRGFAVQEPLELHGAGSVLL